MLTVLLPVYNCEMYLEESIVSVLSQTFTDFTLKIINDGSNDGSRDIIEKYRIIDDRIEAIHKSNEGLSRTLNHAVMFSNTNLIARQDADDLCHPDRFKLQIDFMFENPTIDLVGTWTNIMSSNGVMRNGHKHPLDPTTLDVYGLFDTHFVHSSVLFRRDSILRAGNYSTSDLRNPPEDFDLWLRVLRKSRCANIGIPLLTYREHQESISRQKSNLMDERVSIIAAENIYDILEGGVPFDNVYLYVLDKRKKRKFSFFRNRRFAKIENMIAYNLARKHSVSDQKILNLLSQFDRLL